jgi:hypothetical protein
MEGLDALTPITGACDFLFLGEIDCRRSLLGKASEKNIYVESTFGLVYVYIQQR